MRTEKKCLPDLNSQFFSLFRTLPGYLECIKYFSWPYYGFEILVVNQWSGVENISCPAIEARRSAGGFLTDFDLSPAFREGPIIVDCVVTGDRVIEKLAFDKSNLAFDFSMLVLMSISFHLAALVALYNRIKILGR